MTRSALLPSPKEDLVLTLFHSIQGCWSVEKAEKVVDHLSSSFTLRHWYWEVSSDPEGVFATNDAESNLIATVSTAAREASGCHASVD